ncbi:MAG: T9SS type A sorting domain-containing protein [Taibaiella sp.]|nr:T9SS type A sorting domain-containing protein [Taibaiella sp.]
MKKIYTLFSLLVISLASNAQIANTGFEVWHTQTVSGHTITEPNNWFSLDSLIYAMGPTLYPSAHFSSQMFQSTDAHSGTYSAKLISRQQDSIGIAPGILSNAQAQVNIAVLLSNPSNPLAAVYFSGGTNVTQRIATLKTWIKYLPKGSDMGEIRVTALVAGTSGDSTIGVGDTTIGAISSYTQVTVNINYATPTIVPQKLLIQYFSSAAAGSTPTDSSTMYTDEAATALGIENVPGGDIVVCYPNPTNGMVHLNYSGNEKLTWQIMSINGSIINQKEINGNSSIDLTGMPDGLYFYNIADGNNAIMQRGKITLTK